MDRVEQLTASPTEATPPQHSADAAAESATQQQSPQGPSSAPQASGSQQPEQPAQPTGPQGSVGLGAGTRLPPPTPVKSEADRAYRASASRPLSFTTAEGGQEGPVGLQAGLASPRDAPMRRSSVPVGQSQAASLNRGREGYGVGGTYRLAEAPRPLPPMRGPSTAAHDWMVPEERAMVTNTVPRAKTAGERVQPTLDHAIKDKARYERKAMVNGYALNGAIGLQVILGALVTGLSSVVSPQRVGITTSIIGGLSTLVASYLARMRGSREPELSLARTKDLDHFIRDVQAFQMDKGHVMDGSEDAVLEEFRHRFEELLGNADGERKLSPA